MSGSQCFAVDTFAVDQFAGQLNNVSKKMARTMQADAGQWALIAEQARLIVKEIILMSPSKAIAMDSAWIACHALDSLTVLGEHAVITAAINGNEVPWLRWYLEGGISWHIDFNTGPEEIDALLHSLFPSSKDSAYISPPMFVRVRVIEGSKVIADYSYDEFFEQSRDEHDWKSRPIREPAPASATPGISEIWHPEEKESGSLWREAASPW